MIEFGIEGWEGGGLRVNEKGMAWQQTIMFTTKVFSRFGTNFSLRLDVIFAVFSAPFNLAIINN